MLKQKTVQETLMLRFYCNASFATDLMTALWRLI